ncbi:hypothetical protein [Agarilytica rhodophyticola]|uniref:hypothetical protein n=1 Tax=Agarilytica rhodophyticola TaxID=1737490 RepID=UPI001319D8FE|nr:hypothetical protein [Agarilytica rhodophyticola]
MFNHRHLVKLCQSLSVVLFIAITIFFVRQFPQGFNIDTNLKSMSPEFAPKKDLQYAIDNVSSSIEKRFTLVVYAEDSDQVEEAFDAFVEFVQDGGYSFSVVDGLENFQRYTDLLKQYRFQLLSQQQSLQLDSVSDAQLMTSAKHRLYSLESSAQIFPITVDPFGLLNDFILNSANQLNSNNLNEATAFELDGKQQYFIPIFFNIDKDALDLEIQNSIQQQLQQIKEHIALDYPQIQYLHSGIIFFATDAAKKAKADISTISTGSSIGIFLLLLLTFRSFGALLLPGLSIIFGIALAFTGSHILFGSVHIITIVFGAGLIGVVIDYSLHSFFHKTDKNQVSQLYKALAFSLFTSVIGYGALAFSELSSLTRVAFFSAVGLIGAWVIVVAAAPQLKQKDYTQNSQFLAHILRILNFLLKNVQGRYLWLTCSAILLSFSFLLFKGSYVNDSAKIFFSPNPKLLEQEKTVAELISSYEPGRYIVIKGKSVEEIYQHLNTLKNNIPNFEKTFGVHKLLPSPKQQSHYYQQQSRLYQENGLVQQFLAAQDVEQSVIDNLQTQYRLAIDKVLLPSELFSTTQSGAISLWLEQQEAIFSFILIPKEFDHNSLTSLHHLNDNITVINTAQMVEQSVSSQRQSATLLLALAFILVAILVLLRYRQLVQLRLVLVPLNAIALTVVILYFAGLPLTLFHTMAMFLVLGLGMDYVIFVAEISEHRDQTLHAVILSALTSLLSFGLLSTSDLPVVSAFGTTVLIGNSINLLGAILLSNHIVSKNNCALSEAS